MLANPDEGLRQETFEIIRHQDPAYQKNCGVLMVFRTKDGKFLWQDAPPRVKRGMREFLLPSTTGAALVDGDRLYYVTAECQLSKLRRQVDRLNGGASAIRP